MDGRITQIINEVIGELQYHRTGKVGCIFNQNQSFFSIGQIYTGTCRKNVDTLCKSSEYKWIVGTALFFHLSHGSNLRNWSLIDVHGGQMIKFIRSDQDIC